GARRGSGHPGWPVRRSHRPGPPADTPAAARLASPLHRDGGLHRRAGSGRGGHRHRGRHDRDVPRPRRGRPRPVRAGQRGCEASERRPHLGECRPLLPGGGSGPRSAATHGPVRSHPRHLRRSVGQPDRPRRRRRRVHPLLQRGNGAPPPGLTFGKHLASGYGGQVTNTANLPDASFERDTEYISTRITRDARDGYPIEAGRYRLAAARACPWANRAIIVRRLLGLEDAISLALAGPTHDDDSWTVDLDPGGVEPVLGIAKLKEAYEKRWPGYPKGITVPAIVDVTTGEVVTNDHFQITLDFSTEWTEFHRPGAPDLYPEHLRDQIHEMDELNYVAVNDGVYKAGFATDQRPYARTFDALFERLDWLEDHLSTHRYLVGDTITEADV